MTDDPMSAAFTDDLNGVFIADLTVVNRDVARGARRGTPDERGPLVPHDPALSSEDLTQVAEAPPPTVDGRVVGTGSFASRRRPERTHP